jgi:hypothetical protein
LRAERAVDGAMIVVLACGAGGVMTETRKLAAILAADVV